MNVDFLIQTIPWIKMLRNIHSSTAAVQKLSLTTNTTHSSGWNLEETLCNPQQNIWAVSVQRFQLRITASDQLIVIKLAYQCNAQLFTIYESARSSLKLPNFTETFNKTNSIEWENKIQRSTWTVFSVIHLCDFSLFLQSSKRTLTLFSISFCFFTGCFCIPGLHYLH